jgi:malate/lactate dehydrogenase
MLPTISKIQLSGQNDMSNNYGTFCNNPTFVAVPCAISEDNLYSIIKSNYEKKEVDEFNKNYESYNKYKYAKYLEELILYESDINK